MTPLLAKESQGFNPKKWPVAYPAPSVFPSPFVARRSSACARLRRRCESNPMRLNGLRHLGFDPMQVYGRQTCCTFDDQPMGRLFLFPQLRVPTLGIKVF